MAKINKLVLLGGAAAAYFLLTGKKKETPTATAVVQGGGSLQSFPGYEVINCKTLKITDMSKAKKYAFDSGFNVSKDISVEEQIIYYINKLFGSPTCLGTLNPDENAYTLIKQAFLGVVKKYNYESDAFTVAEGLNDFRKDLGLEPLEDPIYDFLLEMKNTIGGYEFPGYIIGNCNYLWIYDPKEAVAYSYDVGKKGLDYPEWLKETMGGGGCSPENLTQGIDNFWTLYMYSAVGRLNGDFDKVEELAEVLQKTAKEWSEDSGVELQIPDKTLLTAIMIEQEK